MTAATTPCRTLARRADVLGRASCLAGLALVAAPIAAHAAPAHPDPVPVIVTYEQRQARIETHQAVRDPRGFWIRQIVGRLEAKKPALSSLKQPATVHVTFVVGHDGKLVSQTVTRSSGNAVADHAALALVKAAGPFPPMPAAMSDSELTFSIPVRFR